MFADSDSSLRLKFIAAGTILVVFIVIVAMMSGFGFTHQERFTQVYLAVNYDGVIYEAVQKYQSDKKELPSNLTDLEDAGYLDRFNEAKEFWEFVIEDKERIVAFSRDNYIDGEGTEIILEIKTNVYSIYRDEMLIKTWKREGAK